MKKLENKAEYLPLSELVKLENNPRTIKKADFEKLKTSIKSNPDYFEARPIICSDRTGKNVILGGNQRYEAAKALGLVEVPVIVLHGLDEAREREIVIRDNVNNGDWDFDILANEWDESELEDWGLEADWPSDEEDVVEDEAPEVNESEPAMSELGGVYQLGEHRLMCGDSTDAGSVAILMDGQKPDMVFTDPPYELKTDGGGVLKNSHSMTQVKNNSVNHFDPSKLKLWAKTNVFFHNKPLIKAYIELAEDNGVAYDLAIYKKQGLPNYKGHLMTDIEYMAIIGDQDPNQGLRFEDYSKVWEGKKDSDNELSYSKPVELCAKYIKLYSDKTVLDLFGGSGSTLIACEQLGRKSYVMELDPHYCDVIRKRWWKFKTGSEDGWQEGTRKVEA